MSDYEVLGKLTENAQTDEVPARNRPVHRGGEQLSCPLWFHPPGPARRPVGVYAPRNQGTHVRTHRKAQLQPTPPEPNVDFVRQVVEHHYFRALVDQHVREQTEAALQKHKKRMVAPVLAALSARRSSATTITAAWWS